MSCTETLKAHVSPEIKLQAKAVADREFLSEAAWLKRLVLREIRACDAAGGGAEQSSPLHGSASNCEIGEGADPCWTLLTGWRALRA